MDITVSFPGGKRVDAQAGAYAIATDQPVEHGGEGSAPAPYTLFLASLATCAGIYVVGYCQARGLSLAGVRLVQTTEDEPKTGLPLVVRMTLLVPPEFPEEHRAPLARAAAACKVKKTLAHPPAFEVETRAATEPAMGADDEGASATA